MDQPERSQYSRDAFERLVEEYADRVFNVALRITGDRNDAEDAMQEAFLSAYQGWGGFRGESSPKTWLYRITVNAALMRLRSRAPTTYLSVISDEEDIPDWSTTMADIAQRVDLQERLLQGLSQLEPEQRAALVLRDIDGLSTAEAADALDISEQALKSRLHRARSLLRQFLADFFREQ